MGHGERARTGPLTEQQHRIMRLLVQGWEHKAIATKLEVARGTVATNVQLIVAKMGARNSVQAAAMYGAWQVTERMHHAITKLDDCPETVRYQFHEWRKATMLP